MPQPHHSRLGVLLNLSGYALFAGLALASAKWFQVLPIPTAVGVSLSVAGVLGLAVWFFSILRARSRVLKDYAKLMAKR